MIKRSNIGGLLFSTYRFTPLRPGIRAILNRLEGGVMFSDTLRRIYERYYSVSIGKFSYGPGLTPGVFPPGTRIGNYSSIAAGVEVLRRNHPTQRFSQHPLFLIGG